MDEKEQLRQKFSEHANKAGIILNPDKKTVDDIIDKLLIRKVKNGDIYCPCRFVSGDKKKDADNICPCVYHRGEVELQGHCLCTLFYSKTYKPK